MIKTNKNYFKVNDETKQKISIKNKGKKKEHKKRKTK